MPKVTILCSLEDINREACVENCYDMIKELANKKVLMSDNIFSLADLCTELANRLKVEEACGEQED